jgi:hypothetical protein
VRRQREENRTGALEDRPTDHSKPRSFQSLVPNAPVFICRNINANLHQKFKTIYVGNGTPATCIAIEETCVVVKLSSGELVDIQRVLFDIESGYMREQFPLMLGWASSIHKVQGMQFEKLRMDFCLDSGVKAIHDSNRPFRAGMAYMARYLGFRLTPPDLNLNQPLTLNHAHQRKQLQLLQTRKPCRCLVHSYVIEAG